MIDKNVKFDSEVVFLRKLYTKDPLIADRQVLQLLREKYPTSRAQFSTLRSWKCMLRKMGIKIPLKKTME